MLSRLFANPFFLWLAPGLLCPLAVMAQGGSCGACCGPRHCCPKNVVCVPKIPRMKFVRVCPPKPLCNPCDLENYGYFDTCWSAWPFPPTLAHCTAPPVAGIGMAGMPGSAPFPSQNMTPMVPPGADLVPNMPAGPSMPDSSSTPRRSSMGPEVLSPPLH